MRIAQVSVYFYPHMVGGVEWYVYNISKALVNLGHEVDVITTDSFKEKDLEEPSKVEGINIHRLPMRLNLSYRTKIWKGLKNKLKEGNYDLIHTYDYAQPHTFTALKVGNDLKIPVVLTIFDMHSIIPRSLWKQLPMKIFDRFFAGSVMKKADSVLVRAPNLVPNLIQMGLPQEKIRITPSGILDQALGYFEGSKFLNKYSIKGDPIILYLGRLNPMKGPQYLIEAAPKIIQHYPNAKLIFVGPEQDGYSERLFELSDKLGISENISLIGPIYDFEQKMNAYESCNVFVMPSGYEGTSQAIFEAMAHGKPIVASNRGGIPFQVEHEKEALLVEYSDVEGFSKSILRILEDPKLASCLGSRAKSKVKNFTYSVLAHQLDTLFNDLTIKA